MKRIIFAITVIIQTVLHYLGWIGIVLGLVAILFKNFSRGKELVIGGISFLILKYIVGFIFAFVIKKQKAEKIKHNAFDLGGYTAEELLKQSEEIDQFIKKASLKESVVEILRQYNKDVNDLKDIYGLLMAGGAGKEASKQVVINKEYLKKYLEMKQRNISDLEIAVELRKEISKY